LLGQAQIEASVIATALGTSFFPAYSIVLLVVVYGKNEKDDLSEADCRAISQIIRLIEDELTEGRIR